MKQSSGRALMARLSCHKAAFGSAAAIAAAAAVSACGGSSSNTCPNLPQATTVIGQQNFSTATSNTGGISASTVSGPSGSVAVGGSFLYVADTFNNRILGFSPVPTGAAAGGAQFVLGQSSATGAIASTGAGGLANPGKVSVSDTGTVLVVADSGNNRVLIWTTLPASNGAAANVVLGQPDFNSNLPNQNLTPSAATLSNPTAAMIANGHLVVVDKGNNRVLIWNAVPTANDTPADVELGQAATSTTQGNCTGNSGYCFTSNTPNIDQFNAVTNQYTLAMNQPTDVWTDGRRLAISDTTNNRVLYWGVFPNTQNQLPTNLFGQTQFGQGFGSPGSGQSKFTAPSGIGSDNANLYVADTGNNRVLQFSLTALVSNGPNAIGVFGQQDYSHNTANDPDQNNEVGDQRNNPATNGIVNGTLDGPTGVFALPGGANVYITDSVNNRILVIPIGNVVNGTDTNLC
ncbi:MAG: NHL repeat-containing protein [Nevskia sp.]|nr:NHL repeat-containing protein [Nevskia sp.]